MARVEDQSIAVVGVAASFAQDANTIDKFWEVICQGRSCATVIPSGRFNLDTFYDPDPARSDSFNIQRGCFLSEDLSKFDAHFFGNSPMEASNMDPQQRKLMEVTYHALENAGITTDRIAGSDASVYIAGRSTNDYEAITSRDLEAMSPYAVLGNGAPLMPNRISHFFDLHGESLVIDTACSSSLTALHKACRSLQDGESHMSIIAGSNMMLTPETFYIKASKAGLLSPDGVSHSFDSRANGYGRGEGYAAIILKTVAQAVRDGDAIRAVIRATATNTDGRTPSLLAPSQRSQVHLIKKTYLSSGIDPNQTAYVEAHGTGTHVGDPVEANAIGEAFKDLRSPDAVRPLYVGAAKANVGHLEGSSGLTSLVKAILMVERGSIPPVADFKNINPQIEAEKFHLEFPSRLHDWPEGLNVRRVSISNFGYGGANAHCILDDAYSFLRDHGIEGYHTTRGIPPQISSTPKVPVPEARPQVARLLVLSAADEKGIARQASKLASYLVGLKINATDMEEYGDRFCYTLLHRRSRLRWRSFAIVDSPFSFVSRPVDHFSAPFRYASSPEVVFTFTGQGALWSRMGVELLDYEPFRQSVESAERYLQSLGCTIPIIARLEDNEGQDTYDPLWAQTICTVLQVALVDLLRHIGLVPQSVVGHSSGEIAAAYCAGAIPNEAAWTLAYLRGRSLEQLDEGSPESHQGMMVVGLTRTQAQERIESAGFGSKVFVACINSRNTCTLSGLRPSLEALQKSCDEEDVFCRNLNITRAYHSPYMSDAASMYTRLLQDSILSKSDGTASESSARLFSSVTGIEIDHDELRSPSYWVRNLLAPVQFVDALESMLSETIKKHPQASISFVEVGPHPSMKRSCLDSAKQLGIKGASYHSCLRQNTPGNLTLLTMAGELFARGVDTDFDYLNSPLTSDTPKQLLSDLPAYQFDHSARFWFDGRIDQRYRFGVRKRQRFLGVPDIDWNPGQPSWRHIVRAREDPWVLDHQVDDSVIYPASGFYAMAIEAALQIVPSGANIKGIRIKNLSCDRTLEIHEEPKTSEARIHLQPLDLNDRDSTSWHSFVIYGVEETDWVYLCGGHIRVETQMDKGSRPAWIQSAAAPSTATQQHEENAAHSSSFVRSDQFYNNVASYQYKFGPTFRQLQNISFGKVGTRCCSRAMLPSRIQESDTPDIETQSSQRRYFIHPATLDAMFQVSLVAASEGGWKHTPTFLARGARELWLSADLLNVDPSSALEVTSRQVLNGFRDGAFDISARDPHSNRVVVTISDFRSTAAPGLEEQPTSEDAALLFRQVLQQDMTLSSDEDVKAYTMQELNLKNNNTFANLQQAEALTLHFAHSIAQLKLDVASFDASAPHLRKWYDWLLIISKNDSKSYSKITSKRIQQLKENFDSLDPMTKGVMMIGTNLEQILSGEVNPLQLLFGDNFAEQFYAFTMQCESDKAATFVKALAHKNPSLRILEIGAGTGAVTKKVLEQLTVESSTREPLYIFESYTFTDVSAFFLEKASERFAQYGSKMDYKTFDLFKNVASQDLDLDSYDVIIAGAVVHVVPNLGSALRNLSSLLRPNGMLIMIEPTCVGLLHAQFMFGTLSTWWTGEEHERSGTLMVSEEHWNHLLARNGFSGVDLVTRDYPTKDLYTQSTIVSTVAKEAPCSRSSVTHAVFISNDFEQAGWKISDNIKRTSPFSGLSCEFTSAKTAHEASLDQALVVMLCDVDTDFLYDMNEARFKLLQKLVADSKHILWVTKGASGATSRPYRGMVDGMAQVICTERSEAAVTVLSLEEDTAAAQAQRHIVTLMQRILASISTSSIREVHYIEVNGVLSVNRLIPDARLNKIMTRKSGPPTVVATELGRHPKPRVSLTTTSAGLLDGLCFQENAGLRPTLQAGEVEIEVAATSLNFRDVLIALGRIPGNAFGFDGAGIVSSVGPCCPFKKGDRVMFCTTNGLSTYVRCSADLVFGLPADMTFAVAATLPSVYCTAYISLLNLSHLQKGESILIHAAAGGLGQATIQLAKMLGAEIYATVGSAEKRDLLVETYGLQRERILNSRDASFAEGIMSLTKGRGVDVIINSLSGDLMRASLKLLAPFGRFIEVGKRDIDSNAALELSTFSRSATYSALDLSVPEARGLIRSSMLKILELMQNSSLLHEPRPIHRVPSSRVEDAFRMLQSGKVAGKVVVEFKAEDTIDILSMHSKFSLSPDCSYVVVGGFGGIGRQIVKWLAESGARHIMTLSRSGLTDDPDTIAIVTELTNAGVSLQVCKCNVGDKAALAQCLSEYRKTEPPIRGLIHSGMMLDDNSFPNLTLSQFRAPLAPKVDGTWNLHTLLPDDLDFFVMLSSISGLSGVHGQAGYAAGNTFQDAIARHRIAHGQRAVSLNLGGVADAGYLNTREAPGLIQRSGHKMFRVVDVLKTLEIICEPNFEDASQLTLGISTPADFRRVGKEVPEWLARPNFSVLQHVRFGLEDSTAPAAHGVTANNSATLVRGALSDSKAVIVVEDILRQKLAKSLGLPENDVDLSRGFHTIGVDSLMAVELRQWFLRGFQVEVSTRRILSHDSMGAVCEDVALAVRLAGGGGGGGSGAAGGATAEGGSSVAAVGG